MALIDLCERGLVPDFLTRYGIRKLCEQRLRDEHDADLDRADARFRTLLSELRSSPIAIETAAANEQHYEVPTRFFELSLAALLRGVRRARELVAGGERALRRLKALLDLDTRHDSSVGRVSRSFGNTRLWPLLPRW
jgi:hypothetical protein